MPSIPWLIVIAARVPQAVGRLVEILFVGGAKLLNFVATILNNLLGRLLAPYVRLLQLVTLTSRYSVFASSLELFG
jgi:hypothetical protein